ncbi:molybdate ABC transporter substrate-binding protein [Marinobacter mobilis]|uniref:Molybdate transport system substrate-binding protein n=1 Tax=Marinobacter mobilis TaxID=488533 RepID=A0A1H2Q7J7_9GAMM|nr:molybdate ABC transporter substrate-binding protein [Marinobacter mobilis]SDW03187.1 molybdate transport system substrate-binding protein [Marinobacter mobilis]
MLRLALLWPTLLITLLSPITLADEVRIAIAANFTDTSRQLAERFQTDSGHRAIISYGSTGKLYAQIRNGAPFDVFLAADQQRPALLEQQGLAVAGSRFTYASGKLVLWSPNGERFVDGTDFLTGGRFQRLAMANPQTAPYGLAAQQVLQKLALWPALQPRVVRGESIAQTFQFVATANTDAGFVALAQVRAWPQSAGSLWEIPQTYYQPISQQAVLLVRGQDNPAAQAWMNFLSSEPAQALIRQAGYGAGP